MLCIFRIEMGYWPKSESIVNLFTGLFLFLGGAIWISPGYEAVLLNEIIQPGHKHSWMTGGQAVAAGIALVVLGSLQIAAFIISRAKRGIKQRPVGRST
jgi:hypothetical protein